MFKKMIVAAILGTTLLGFGGMETASAAPHGFHNPPGHNQQFDLARRYGCVHPPRKSNYDQNTHINKPKPNPGKTWKCGRGNNRGNYQSVPRPGSHRRLHR